MEVNYAKSQIRSDVSTFYDSRIRRRSPWDVTHLEKLDRLREEIEGQSD